MSAGLVRMNAESAGVELQTSLSSLRRLKRCVLSRNYDDDIDTSGVSYSACIICCPRRKLDQCSD